MSENNVFSKILNSLKKLNELFSQLSTLGKFVAYVFVGLSAYFGYDYCSGPPSPEPGPSYEIVFDTSSMMAEHLQIVQDALEFSDLFRDQIAENDNVALRFFSGRCKPNCEEGGLNGLKFDFGWNNEKVLDEIMNLQVDQLEGCSTFSDAVVAAITDMYRLKLYFKEKSGEEKNFSPEIILVTAVRDEACFPGSFEKRIRERLEQLDLPPKSVRAFTINDIERMRVIALGLKDKEIRKKLREALKEIKVDPFMPTSAKTVPILFGRSTDVEGNRNYLAMLDSALTFYDESLKNENPDSAEAKSVSARDLLVKVAIQGEMPEANYWLGQLYLDRGMISTAGKHFYRAAYEGHRKALESLKQLISKNKETLEAMAARDSEIQTWLDYAEQQ